MTTPKTARAVVGRILKDLTDRKGLRHVWDEIDETIQEEIYDTWLEIVDEEIKKKDKE
jgi:hypothetical protein